MSHKFNVVWIDDQIKRAEDYIGGLDGALRGTSVETKLEVVEITESFLVDLDHLGEKWITTPPDLIMLDHNFTAVPKRLFDIRGSALAHLLRIRLPNVPIVCVSGQDIRSDQFNIEDLSEYTYVFDVNQINIEENLERIFAIAKDFKQICFPIKQPVRQRLVEVLHTPEIDQVALMSVLPEEFESEYLHGVSPHRIARWILNVFMKHQGFLYDSLEAATILGLSEKAFTDKVKNRFEQARYTGPFATDSTPLWWASSLIDVLYASLPEHSALVPQDAGRKFEGITEADFSRCAVTNQHTPAPDVVAFTDATETTRRAVRHNFAIQASDSAGSLPGFSTRLRIRNSRRGN